MGRQIIHTEFQRETPWKITSWMTKKEVKHYVIILKKNCFRGQNLQLCGSGSYPMADWGICGVHPLAYTNINLGMFNIYPQSHHF